MPSLAVCRRCNRFKMSGMWPVRTPYPVPPYPLPAQVAAFLVQHWGTGAHSKWFT